MNCVQEPGWTPNSLQLLKQAARVLQSEQNIQYSRALECVSRAYGWKSYSEARKVLQTPTEKSEEIVKKSRQSHNRLIRAHDKDDKRDKTKIRTTTKQFVGKPLPTPVDTTAARVVGYNTRKFDER